MFLVLTGADLRLQSVQCSRHSEHAELAARVAAARKWDRRAAAASRRANAARSALG